MQIVRNCRQAVVMLLVASSTATAATHVTLRERVSLSGPVVRLADVADVVDTDRQRGRQLGALPLMPAPAPGTQRFLRLREVEDLLSAHGVDMKELRIDGASQVHLTTSVSIANRKDASGSGLSSTLNRHAAILAGKAQQPIASEIDATRSGTLHDDICGLLTQHVSTNAGRGGAWRVTCDIPDRHLALFEAATTAPSIEGGGSPWSGRQRFTVSFKTADGPVQFPVYAEVFAPSVPVVVAVQPIARGDVFTAAVIELRDVDHAPQATDRRAAIGSVEQLIGMEARQAIQAGDVVFTDHIQAPVLVKRGDLVTVYSQGGGIRVRTTAKARQEGARGALVQVESLDTRERYDVRVVGPREAAIVAIARSAPEEPAERLRTVRR